jgi:hypothetical protein
LQLRAQEKEKTNEEPIPSPKELPLLLVTHDDLGPPLDQTFLSLFISDDLLGGYG